MDQMAGSRFQIAKKNDLLKNKSFFYKLFRNEFTLLSEIYLAIFTALVSLITVTFT